MRPVSHLGPLFLNLFAEDTKRMIESAEEGLLNTKLITKEHKVTRMLLCCAS